MHAFSTIPSLRSLLPCNHLAGCNTPGAPLEPPPLPACARRCSPALGGVPRSATAARRRIGSAWGPDEQRGAAMPPLLRLLGELARMCLKGGCGNPSLSHSRDLLQACPSPGSSPDPRRMSAGDSSGPGGMPGGFPGFPGMGMPGMPGLNMEALQAMMQVRGLGRLQNARPAAAPGQPQFCGIGLGQSAKALRPAARPLGAPAARLLDASAPWRQPAQLPAALTDAAALQQPPARPAAERAAPRTCRRPPDVRSRPPAHPPPRSPRPRCARRTPTSSA